MKKGMLLFFMAFICFTFFISCSRNKPDAGPLQIALTSDVSNPSSRAASVTGLSGQELSSLRAAKWNDETWQALGTLPEHQRTALVLRFYLDLKVDEIATVLGIPAGTVKSQIHRGLAALSGEVTR